MNDVTCRGSYALGTACGHCSRCFGEAAERFRAIGAAEAREVSALGSRIGFGRLMQLAEQEWERYLGGTGGEFTVGPCRATLARRGLRDCMHLLDEYDRLHRLVFGDRIDGGGQ